MKSIKGLQKELKKWFSRYIRMRDSMDGRYGTCITCGITKEIKYMDHGHFMKAGNHPATRYDEKNCNLQCKHCNYALQGDDSKYAERIDDKYGQGTAEMLRIKANNPSRLDRWAYEVLIDEYKQKYRELVNMHGYDPWKS